MMKIERKRALRISEVVTLLHITVLQTLLNLYLTILLNSFLERCNVVYEENSFLRINAAIKQGSYADKGMIVFSYGKTPVL